MSSFGARAYSKVGIESSVISADPHRLVQMLFDAALQEIDRAEGHLAARRIPAKCKAIGKACRIINEGLRAAIKRDADPVLPGRLILLYDYVMMRLVQANLRNDIEALREARRLFADLRDAWVAIAPKVAAGVAAAPAAPVAARPALAGYGAAPAARRFTVTA